ncbi:MAG: hypothetical protein J1D77_01600 [Muribaculaceae bacterium]|nr:hypothetical protein [Muribaculaceae bacterium]
MNSRITNLFNFCIIGSVLLVACLLFSSQQLEAKKIKHSFTIAKEKKGVTKKNVEMTGCPISMADSLAANNESVHNTSTQIHPDIFQCGFAGYDKEPNSNIESFILINKSGNTITGYEVRIDYLDMQGRMLHSRVVKEPCEVPPHETRRLDIKSWDTQRTYYYYLGNAPRKVATPYQVNFTPLTFWVI